MFKRLLCYVFGHKYKVVFRYDYIRIKKCQRCKAREIDILVD